MAGNEFYSNCLIETARAIIKSGFTASPVNLSHRTGHNKGRHYGWRKIDGTTWHFCTIKGYGRPWWRNLWLKGEITRLIDFDGGNHA